MNTSLVNVNFDEWQNEDKNHEWFTITSGRVCLVFFVKKKNLFIIELFYI
jgi:hypothetical protein